MPADFAGREFDEELLRDLPPGADPCGERGEFHTCVYAGPMFSAPLPIETGEIVTRDRIRLRRLRCCHRRRQAVTLPNLATPRSAGYSFRHFA